MKRSRVSIFLILLVFFFCFVFSNIDSKKRIILKNGLTLNVIKDSDCPLMAVHVLFKNRSYNEGRDKSGMVDLIHRMLNTRKVKEKLLEIGGEIQTNDLIFLPFDDYYTTNEFSYIRFKTLNEFCDRGFELLSEVIIHPDLGVENFKRSKRELMMAENFYNKKVQKVGFRKLFEVISPNTYLTFPIYGDRNSIKNITYKEVLSFYGRYFRPENCIISVYSANDVDKIIDAVERYFGNWGRGKKGVPFKFVEAKVNTKVSGKNISLKSPSKIMGFLCGGYGIKLEKKDIYPLMVFMSIFSDSYSFLLREKKGLAYSLGGGLMTLNCRKDGVIYFYILTQKKNVLKALKITGDFMKRFGSGKIDRRDVEVSKNRLIGKLLRRFIPSLNKAYFMGIFEFCGRDFSKFMDSVRNLKNVKYEDVLRVKGKYFSPDKFNYIILK